MQRHVFNKLTCRHGLVQFTQRREMHSRNKEAMELIAKGWSALKEVDRVIDYCELNDCRLIPLLRASKSEARYGVSFKTSRGSLARKARNNAESHVRDQADMARERFQIAAKAGCDLGLKWLERLEEEEKHLLTGSN